MTSGVLTLMARGPDDITPVAIDEYSPLRPWKYIDRSLPPIRREGPARQWEYWVREHIAARYSDMTFSINIGDALIETSRSTEGLPPLPDWLFGPGRQPRARLEDLWETVTGERPVVHEPPPNYDNWSDWDSDLDSDWDSDLCSAAEDFRLRAVFKAYRAGLAEQRREVERAARVIGEAVLEWSCRPGGACARAAQRSFEQVDAPAALATASSRRLAD